jgi:quercetin dioxygenase-like cupin family protein
MSVVRSEEQVGWQPHPAFKGVRIKYLLTKRDDCSDITCILLMVPKGGEIPEHLHTDKVDVMYPLSGVGKQWVEDLGDFELRKGMIIRVPMGKKHRTYGVTEDLVLFDIFSPATV